VLHRTLRPGGSLVLASFGPAGPTRCSSLPVNRYSAADLSRTLGPGFELVSARLEDHETPAGRSQQFLYALMRRDPATG
jgi:hypothetical protein